MNGTTCYQHVSPGVFANDENFINMCYPRLLRGLKKNNNQFFRVEIETSKKVKVKIS